MPNRQTAPSDDELLSAAHVVIRFMAASKLHSNAPQDSIEDLERLRRSKLLRALRLLIQHCATVAALNPEEAGRIGADAEALRNAYHNLHAGLGEAPQVRLARSRRSTVIDAGVSIVLTLAAFASLAVTAMVSLRLLPNPHSTWWVQGAWLAAQGIISGAAAVVLFAAANRCYAFVRRRFC